MVTPSSPGFVAGATYFQTSSVPAVNAVGAMSGRKDGFTGGGQLGYNFQFQQFVAGLEGDFNYLGADRSETGSANYPCCGFPFTITQRARAEWLATARLRLGWTVNSVLIYATGGLAFANLHYSGVFTDTSGAAEAGSISTTRTGWALGAGIEYAITRNWSVKAEYLHADLGSESAPGGLFTAGGPFPGTVFRHSVSLRTDIARLGINYRFEMGAPPVVAKY
jgi:outer membrane immunogenic protein